MTWRWPWRRVDGASEEACAVLERIEGRDREVAALGEELQAVRRRNHFSEMVDRVITGRAKEGS